MDGENSQLTLEDVEASIEDDAESENITENQQDSEASKYLTDLIRSRVNARQELLLSQEFADFREWMVEEGKNQKKKIGLADSTADNYIDRLDELYRTVWADFTDGKPLNISHRIADDICEALNRDTIQNGDEPYSTSQKRKTNDTLRKYFEYRHYEKGGETWDPPYKFNDQIYSSPDYLTKRERRQIREAALTYDTLPSYSDTTPEQRDKLKTYLSQKLEKPKEKLTPDDWKENNRSWERPSLVWMSLDAGLRPIEVARIKVGWLRLEKNSLHIPKDQSAKSREEWEIALKPETVEALKRWLAERERLLKYDDTDQLWLTREANPWKSNALNYLFDQLLEEAGIDQENRRLCWYSIRHSVGEHMTDEGNLSETKAQLRHKSMESTLQYTDPSVETRQSTLEKMEQS
jgi:integrase